MNKKNRAVGGFSPLLIMAIVFLVYMLVFQVDINKSTMSYEEFTKVLKEDKIESVEISQSRSVPTGSIEITFKDKDAGKRQMEVSDVNEIQKVLEEAGVDDIKVLPVQQESWFLTSLLPTLIMVGAFSSRT